MSNFMENLQKETVKKQLGYTENGALVYTTCGDNLTDFNFHISSMRDKDGKEIYKEFKQAYLDNKELAIRYLFFAGDIREGLGERHVFKEIMHHLAYDETDIARAVLSFIPEYGRWDEVVDLLNTPIKDDVVKMIKEQLDKDVQASKDGNTISLCAKWMPSINAANKTVRSHALTLCSELNLSKSEYRHMLSNLRDKLNIIEKALAEKDIEKLDSMQESFSSKQNFKYKKALMNLMPEQRAEYFNKVLKGEANFNADVLEPHEIYYRYRTDNSIRGVDMSYEVMWKKLPNKVHADNQVLVMRDGSGSMITGIPGTNNGQILDISSALAVYFSEHTEGQFKNKFITFSSRPEIVDLSGCDNLYEKMQKLYHYDDCSNTNIEKAFDVILESAINNHMSQEELPQNLLIISDMEFDKATSSYAWRRDVSKKWDKTLFGTIRQKYEDAGYKIPRLIFWNVNNRTNTVPEVDNELGLVLLGGYSKNNIDMICEGNFTKEIINEKGETETVQLSPAEILANQLMSERYDAIGNAIKPILDKKRI